MVAAYLRGFLKPNHRFGLRSSLAEDVVLEALAADTQVQSMLAGIQADTGLLPVLNERGIRKTVERINAHLTRVNELRGLDIYKVADQLAGRLKIENRTGELSLFQLYHLAEKKGIFEAFDELTDESKAKPLL